MKYQKTPVGRFAEHSSNLKRHQKTFEVKLLEFEHEGRDLAATSKMAHNETSYNGILSTNGRLIKPKTTLTVTPKLSQNGYGSLLKHMNIPQSAIFYSQASKEPVLPQSNSIFFFNRAHSPMLESDSLLNGLCTKKMANNGAHPQSDAIYSSATKPYLFLSSRIAEPSSPTALSTGVLNTGRQCPTVPKKHASSPNNLLDFEQKEFRHSIEHNKLNFVSIATQCHTVSSNRASAFEQTLQNQLLTEQNSGSLGYSSRHCIHFPAIAHNQITFAEYHSRKSGLNCDKQHQSTFAKQKFSERINGQKTPVQLGAHTCRVFPQQRHTYKHSKKHSHISNGKSFAFNLEVGGSGLQNRQHNVLESEKTGSYKKGTKAHRLCEWGDVNVLEPLKKPTESNILSLWSASRLIFDSHEVVDTNANGDTSLSFLNSSTQAFDKTRPSLENKSLTRQIKRTTCHSAQKTSQELKTATPFVDESFEQHKEAELSLFGQSCSPDSHSKIAKTKNILACDTHSNYLSKPGIPHTSLRGVSKRWVMLPNGFQLDITSNVAKTATRESGPVVPEIAEPASAVQQKSFAKHDNEPKNAILSPQGIVLAKQDIGPIHGRLENEKSDAASLAVRQPDDVTSPTVYEPERQNINPESDIDENALSKVVSLCEPVFEVQKNTYCNGYNSKQVTSRIPQEHTGAGNGERIRVLGGNVAEPKGKLTSSNSKSFLPKTRKNTHFSDSLCALYGAKCDISTLEYKQGNLGNELALPNLWMTRGGTLALPPIVTERGSLADQNKAHLQNKREAPAPCLFHNKLVLEQENNKAQTEEKKSGEVSPKSLLAPNKHKQLQKMRDPKFGSRRYNSSPKGAALNELLSKTQTKVEMQKNALKQNLSPAANSCVTISDEGRLSECRKCVEMIPPLRSVPHQSKPPERILSPMEPPLVMPDYTHKDSIFTQFAFDEQESAFDKVVARAILYREATFRPSQDQSYLSYAVARNSNTVATQQNQSDAIGSYPRGKITRVGNTKDARVVRYNSLQDVAQHYEDSGDGSHDAALLHDSCDQAYFDLNVNDGRAHTSASTESPYSQSRNTASLVTEEPCQYTLSSNAAPFNSRSAIFVPTSDGLNRRCGVENRQLPMEKQRVSESNPYAVRREALFQLAPASAERFGPAVSLHLAAPMTGEPFSSSATGELTPVGNITKDRTSAVAIGKVHHVAQVENSGRNSRSGNPEFVFSDSSLAQMHQSNLRTSTRSRHSVAHRNGQRRYDNHEDPRDRQNRYDCENNAENNTGPTANKNNLDDDPASIRAAASARSFPHVRPQMSREDGVGKRRFRRDFSAQTRREGVEGTEEEEEDDDQALASEDPKEDTEAVNKGRRPNFNDGIKRILLNWLDTHTDYPYPSEKDKLDLSKATKLSLKQVSNWFVNARRRNLRFRFRSKRHKRMVDAMKSDNRNTTRYYNNAGFPRIIPAIRMPGSDVPQPIALSPWRTQQIQIPLPWSAYSISPPRCNVPVTDVTTSDVSPYNRPTAFEQSQTSPAFVVNTGYETDDGNPPSLIAMPIILPSMGNRYVYQQNAFISPEWNAEHNYYVRPMPIDMRRQQEINAAGSARCAGRGPHYQAAYTDNEESRLRQDLAARQFSVDNNLSTLQNQAEYVHSDAVSTNATPIDDNIDLQTE